MEVKLKQDLPNLAINLKRLRNEAGYTQDQIVAKMQIKGCTLSRSTYSKVEQARYSVRLSELECLREIYNVDYNTLFAGVKIKNHEL